MSRAKAFTRLDVAAGRRFLPERAAIPKAVMGQPTPRQPPPDRLNPNEAKKIETILRSLRIGEPTAREIKQAIVTYRLRILSDNQERPAKIVATLKLLQVPSQVLQERLCALPEGVRLQLRLGGIEGLLGDLIANVAAQMNYWQGKVHAHRSRGEGCVGLELRKSLDAILAKHIANEPKRRAAIVNILAAAKISFPDAKKTGPSSLEEASEITVQRNVPFRWIFLIHDLAGPYYIAAIHSRMLRVKESSNGT